MEGILYQRVSPLLKCVVLFLFIFTAKVLTTRPQETQDGKNSIQHLKTNHFVRTFTKYHHRRTIQWNQDYWPSDDQPKVIQKRNAEPISSYKKRTRRIVKRNADIPNSNEFIESTKRKYPLSLSESLRDNFEKTAISINDNDNTVSNKISKNKFKVKPTFIPTSAPIVHKGSTITCLYKTNRISYSSTPTYDDDKNAQSVVENESFDVGRVSVEMLPNGQTVQVEQCTDPRAYCYTLWHQDGDGNVTVLGQGCWRSAARAGPGGCDRCTVTPRLPATKFCCCTTSYCNTQSLNIEDETVPLAAQSTLAPPTAGAAYGGAAVTGALALLVLLAVAAIWHRRMCTTHDKQTEDLEKVDVMGSGPDAMATGLLCVDNLTLSEHIGSGKFGSVWRGSLGGAPVAVKLHASAATWKKEANIYTIPHLQHPNILRYYGSDTRATLDGGREHLLVLELCSETLRSKLTRDTLTWAEFATLAHGLAAALAHLHTPVGSKPCVVHRDVNSNNVLVVNNQARLADLGLAQCVPPPPPPPPPPISEAGTLRYLAPEALEGALDLSEARAALCAVDVFALALVTWEMLWRTSGAHNGATPPYAPPYSHHGLPAAPTLAQMQSLVSRNKARPPLPLGGAGGADSRALRIANDTCDECWDHDAEARLTAVCVEERMSELKLLLRAHPPLARPNNLHSDSGAAPESDKNSNVTSSQPPPLPQALPPPPLPSLGRNACAQRNTHTCTEQEHTLVHRSLKDTPEVIEAPPTSLDNCLSVARDENRIRTFAYENSDRMNEIRSYPRPIEFVPNDVTATEPRTKRTNLLREERHKWGIRRFFEKRLGKSRLETEVKLIPEKQERNGRIQTSIVEPDRPSNLVLDQERNYHLEPCTLSPPNRTLSPTMLLESELNRESRVLKELPCARADHKHKQIFAVIVPRAKPHDDSLIELQTAGSSDSTAHIKSALEPSDDSNKRTQHSGVLTNSGRSSRASINLELQYLDNQEHLESPFDINSDCSSSEDEQLMLLSEDGGSKITMQAIPKPDEKRKYQNDVLKETHKTENYNFQNKYKSFDNEFSDPADKENLVNGYSGDNPVYIAALNGEILSADLKLLNENEARQNKPPIKSLTIKRQHSLEQVSEIFTSSGDVALLNPAGRVKTPGDLPAAVRRARSNRQHQRRGDSNRLSLYDDRIMFGNSL